MNAQFRFASALVFVIAAAAPARGAVLLVCEPTAACPGSFVADGVTGFSDLNAAAAHAADDDTILVWPGVYPAEATIRASNVTVRGMDRYGVVLDGGETRGVGLTGGRDDGSVIHRNITFENMTGKKYRSHSFFWVNVEGYSGRYLTGYNNQGYGVYAFESAGDPLQPSEIRNSYASGNADSGFYIGGCNPCNAVIDTVWSEGNALGYSGTNAGGNLVLQNSEWNNNIAGIVPNTLPSEPYGPQRGAVIRGNLVHDNNNASAPVTGLTGLAPLGTGILIAGGWQNQVFGNTIFSHKHYAVALSWLETPPTHNQIFDNTVYANDEADLVDVGPGSVNNCFSRNVNPGEPEQEPTSQPPMIQSINSCANPVQVVHFPNPMFTTNVAGITEPRTPGDAFAQPEPPTPLSAAADTALREAALACMPNPCDGIPDNAFCTGGAPVARAQSAECAASL
ncbi:MAG: right-handed parallel beta-helix repeat-containing protein [Candidatus Binatia bacterium]